MRHATVNRPIAVITGATSGIGREFARQLAERSYDLVITGRRKEKIAELVRELSDLHGTQVETIICELGNVDHVERLAKRLQEKPDISLLVNNAGFGIGTYFSETEILPLVEMVRVHAEASMRLIHAVIPAMQRRQRGAIINVSSMASYAPGPGNAVYSATKAFLTTLSEALYQELRRDGIVVQALLPGFTRTDFHTRMAKLNGPEGGSSSGAASRPDPGTGCGAGRLEDAGKEDSAKEGAGKEGAAKEDPGNEEFVPAKTAGLPYMTSAQVVRASLRALDRGQPICIPGAGYRALAALIRFLPRSIRFAVMRARERRSV